MVEDLKQLKQEFVELMEEDIHRQGGIKSINNIKMHGEIADIIKDLSEAIYYCEVTEAMEGGGQGLSGYGTSYGRGRSGYGSSMTASGNGLMGHSDPMSAIRDIMMSADPETKMRIRSELGMM